MKILIIVFICIFFILFKMQSDKYFEYYGGTKVKPIKKLGENNINKDSNKNKNLSVPSKSKTNEHNSLLPSKSKTNEHSSSVPSSAVIKGKIYSTALNIKNKDHNKDHNKDQHGNKRHNREQNINKKYYYNNYNSDYDYPWWYSWWSHPWYWWYPVESKIVDEATIKKDCLEAKNKAYQLMEEKSIKFDDIKNHWENDGYKNKCGDL